MTANVTIKSVSWPVEVTVIALDPHQGIPINSNTYEIEPNSEKVDYIHQTRKIEVRELPLRETDK